MTKLKLTYHFFSLDQLIKLTSQKMIFPFYHTISDDRLAHISNLYQLKTKKQFEQDLDYLCKHYKPVSLKEIEDIIYSDKEITKPLFHLSFDDGLRELYTDVVPILEKKGIPATIFINTDFVDNKELFFRYKVSLIIEEVTQKNHARSVLSSFLEVSNENTNEIKKRLLSFGFSDIPLIDEIAKLLEIDFNDFLKVKKPYLTRDQIKIIIEKGFSIGSHSLNHPMLRDLDLSEKKRQISESFTYLKREFNIDDLYFSFPFSDESVERDFFNWLYNDANCKLSFGISGIKQDFTKFHLHRIPFELGSNIAENILKGEYLYYIIKSFFKRNRISRQ